MFTYEQREALLAVIEKTADLQAFRMVHPNDHQGINQRHGIQLKAEKVFNDAFMNKPRYSPTICTRCATMNANTDTACEHCGKEF